MAHQDGVTSSGSRRVIKFKTHLRNTILDVLRSRGWKETDSESDWDFNWADVFWIRECMDHFKVEDRHHLNHYRNHYELTRKDLMVKNIRRMRRVWEKEGRLEDAAGLDFLPATFSLPADYSLFEVEFKRHPNAVWIMKPPAKAQGKGIFLFTKLSQVAEWRRDFQRTAAQGAQAMVQSRLNALATGSSRAEQLQQRQGQQQQQQAAGQGGASAAALEAKAQATQAIAEGQGVEPYLAQRYIDNPHLVGGKKYDMRIYCLVTSWAPMTVWLYRSAFCRFCHHRFNLDDVDNTFIHVTNVAVQKTNPNYSAESGCKWGIRSLKQHIGATQGPAAANDAMWAIQTLILRSLQAVSRVMMQDRHCFELYGYDVMLDDTLKPWLIECNASPSLTAETPADYHLKFNLLEDMLSVLDLERVRSGTETRVGGFDLLWANNAPAGIAKDALRLPPGAVRSYLGCPNDLAIPMARMRFPPKMGEAASERLLV